ncbi:hypothetical protein ASE94_08295 [Devosia sp. Leaf64]|nr:hypothetical protein ASE94_08295 [Devosia sp. Leaf64]
MLVEVAAKLLTSRTHEARGPTGDDLNDDDWSSQRGDVALRPSQASEKRLRAERLVRKRA